MLNDAPDGENQDRVYAQENAVEARLYPGIVEGRLWWEQTSDYWDMPFFTEVGIFDAAVDLSDRDDWLAAREQLWAMREGYLN